MESKSEDGNTLDRIKRDIMVENEIFMYNSTKQARNNTEMQIAARNTEMDLRTTDPHCPWPSKSESVIKIVKGKIQENKISEKYNQ